MANRRDPVSVLMVDVDHFKRYNDHYGHGAGDECLIAIGALLKASVARRGDLVARYGGEQFVVLLSEAKLDGAAGLAQSLCADVAALAIDMSTAKTDWTS
ncbi:MAG: diguanylate cyclase [Rhizobiaceae bacterium]|nr:diguanylate cyclase [Rhizobiaceae bacterium]